MAYKLGTFPGKSNSRTYISDLILDGFIHVGIGL